MLLKLNATFPPKYLLLLREIPDAAGKTKNVLSEKKPQILNFFTSPCSLRFVHLFAWRLPAPLLMQKRARHAVAFPSKIMAIREALSFFYCYIHVGV
jgi:hypothetical protein